MTPRRINKLPPLYLITNRKSCSPDLLTALELALRGGVRLVQLREKDLPLSKLEALAEKALKLTRGYGARLLLNDKPELALKIGADGVQLGIQSCKVTTARRLLGNRALIGYSAHSIQELEDSVHQDADFFTFSPIYDTPSKAPYGPPQGIEALRDACRSSRRPIYALGGITDERISEVLKAGACGVAAISAILSVTNTQKAVQKLLKTLSIEDRS